MTSVRPGGDPGEEREGRGVGFGAEVPVEPAVDFVDGEPVLPFDRANPSNRSEARPPAVNDRSDARR